MDRSSAIEVARYLTSLLEEAGIKVDQTILFGSCARDQANEDSDVDIAIVSTAFKDKDLLQRGEFTMYARLQAIRQFHVPIDVLEFTPEEYIHSNSLAAQFVRADGVSV